MASSSRVETASGTDGTCSRRDCFAASRTVDRQRDKDFAARSPDHRTTEREAIQGMISATPASVSISIASSERSPLASACTATIRRRGSGAVSSSVTSTCRPVFCTATTVPRTPRPQPSPTMIISPGRVRRTTAACRPSSPPSAIWSPTAGQGSPRSSAKNSGSVMTDPL